MSGGVPPALPPPPLSSLGVLANRPELKSLTRLIGELLSTTITYLFVSYIRNDSKAWLVKSRLVFASNAKRDDIKTPQLSRSIMSDS